MIRVAWNGGDEAHLASLTTGAVMMGWGYANGGMHAGWWITMGVFWIAVIVSGLWGLAHLFPRGADPRSPTAILKERLASGEITLAEYKKLLAEVAPETSGE